MDMKKRQLQFTAIQLLSSNVVQYIKRFRIIPKFNIKHNILTRKSEINAGTR